MTPQERTWFENLLDVRPPWQVQSMKINAEERLVSVQIGPQPETSGPFWAPKRSAQPTRRMHWTHLGLAGQRCEVTLALREGQRIPATPWAGDPELPFTHALSRLVLDLMLDGATMSQLCRMLDLPLSELWKYKYRLDHGAARAPQANGQAPAPAKAAAPAPAVAPTPAPTPTPIVMPTPVVAEPVAMAVGTPASDFPAEDSPVWLALLTGRQTLDVQALGLKLLLSKLMREAATHRDADLHRQAAQNLHRYFVRNQPLLSAEIEQLKRAEAAAQAAAQRAAQAQAAAAAVDEDGPVPDVSDPMWQALLSGDYEIEVRTLSLRLLLAKLRQQARTLKDDELRMLKLVELHRYFAKHHAVLHHELAQLKRWPMH